MSTSTSVKSKFWMYSCWWDKLYCLVVLSRRIQETISACWPYYKQNIHVGFYLRYTKFDNKYRPFYFYKIMLNQSDYIIYYWHIENLWSKLLWNFQHYKKHLNGVFLATIVYFNNGQNTFNMKKFKVESTWILNL